MRNIVKAGLICLGLLAGVASQAQTDPHFSQYYAYPMWLNPGLTGAIDGNYRVTALYRSQWGNLNNPFSTPGVSADFVTNKNLNLGVNILNQRAGNGGYSYLNTYASMAYTGVRFGDHQISMGMSFGMISRRFDPSKFILEDASEIVNKTSASSFDAGAGIVYYDGTAGKKANLFLGFSAFHLTQPEDPFINTGNHEKMPIRYTAHGGIRFNLSETVSLTPNLLFMRQGDAEEKMAGAYAQFKVTATTDFLLGANYRFDDAVSPYAGVYFNNMVLGLSYDVNTSDLGKMMGNANSFEISLTFMGKNAVKADAVPFICPRL